MTQDSGRILRVTRRFDFAPQCVFDAWLDPQGVCKWLFATPTGQIARAEIDPRPGGKFVIVDRRDGEDVEHLGEYLELDPPRRLIFTFAVPKYSSQSTRVSVDIAPAGTGCELTLSHQGVLPEWFDRTRQGWTMILDALDSTLRHTVSK